MGQEFKVRLAPSERRTPYELNKMWVTANAGEYHHPINYLRQITELLKLELLEQTKGWDSISRSLSPLLTLLTPVCSPGVPRVDPIVVLARMGITLYHESIDILREEFAKV